MTVTFVCAGLTDPPSFKHAADSRAVPSDQLAIEHLAPALNVLHLRDQIMPHNTNTAFNKYLV